MALFLTFKRSTKTRSPRTTEMLPKKKGRRARKPAKKQKKRREGLRKSVWQRKPKPQQRVKVVLKPLKKTD